MSNISSYVSSKSFIEIHKAYGPNQHLKDIKVKDHTLDLKVVKLEQHISKVTSIKEETQELPKHECDLTIITEDTQLKPVEKQKSNVQIGRFIID
jgi:hypothetical protein